jgi:elongation factor P hydroxylase
MLLSPLSLAALPALLAEFGARLPRQGLAHRLFGRIAASLDGVVGCDLALSQDPLHHRQALALLARFGIMGRPGSPADGVTWDGRCVALAMEPSVIIHEVAHYQVAPPSRRGLVDFGLGAGPESGDRQRAEVDRRCRALDGDREEALASLLGVVWEAELGQPAILAFVEQNWLEGDAAPHNLAHFRRVVARLARLGLIDRSARPTVRLRNGARPGRVSQLQAHQYRHQQRGDDTVETHRQA